jgi:CcmD family protein
MNFLLEPGVAIYMALLVALAVWIGVFIFLWRIDRQAREIRRRLDEEQPVDTSVAPRAMVERAARPVAATETQPRVE